MPKLQSTGYPEILSQCDTEDLGSLRVLMVNEADTVLEYPANFYTTLVESETHVLS